MCLKSDSGTARPQDTLPRYVVFNWFQKISGYTDFTHNFFNMFSKYTFFFWTHENLV